MRKKSNQNWRPSLLGKGPIVLVITPGFFVIDDRETHYGAEITLVKRGTAPPEGASMVVESPSTHGIAALRSRDAPCRATSDRRRAGAALGRRGRNVAHAAPGLSGPDPSDDRVLLRLGSARRPRCTGAEIDVVVADGNAQRELVLGAAAAPASKEANEGVSVPSIRAFPGTRPSRARSCRCSPQRTESAGR